MIALFSLIYRWVFSYFPTFQDGVLAVTQDDGTGKSCQRQPILYTFQIFVIYKSLLEIHSIYDYILSLTFFTSKKTTILLPTAKPHIISNSILFFLSFYILIGTKRKQTWS